MWQIYGWRVDWFELREGEYVPMPLDERGVLHSRIFPGLRLAVPLLEDNLAGVLAELQQGLGIKEHAAFVARLAQT